MNFSISKEKFSHLLYLTNSIVERRNTMPILANVKITAEDGRIKVAATDLEVSLLGETESSVKTAGSITIDAKMIYEIVRELPNDTVIVNLSKGQRLEIECGLSRFKINGVSADEFPSVAGVMLNNPVTVDAAKLYEMIDKTLFAVSNDETRHNINGVFVETMDGVGNKQNLRFVATDGHRLAMIDRPSEGLILDSSVIIPRKGLHEMKKVLEGNDGVAHVGVMEGFFTLRSGSVTLGTRLVDGQFPDYRQVVPMENTATVQINRAELFSAVKRVSLVTTDRNKAIKVKLVSGTLLISSSSPEYGEASESVEVEQKGDDVSIGFSSKYLLDVLTAMSSNEVITLKLNGELGPGVFIGGDDPAYTCIVMPMRFE